MKPMASATVMCMTSTSVAGATGMRSVLLSAQPESAVVIEFGQISEYQSLSLEAGGAWQE